MYKRTYFRGEAVEVTEDVDDLDNLNFSDKLVSLKVQGDCNWIIFSGKWNHHNFKIYFNIINFRHQLHWNFQNLFWRIILFKCYRYWKFAEKCQFCEKDVITCHLVNQLSIYFILYINVFPWQNNKKHLELLWYKCCSCQLKELGYVWAKQS